MITKITGCSVCVHRLCKSPQIVLNESLIACFNYSIISLHLAYNTAPPIGDMFIQRLRILQSHDVCGTKGGMANERDPFISACHSMVRDNLHFEMHYSTHNLSGTLSLRYRVLLTLV